MTAVLERKVIDICATTPCRRSTSRAPSTARTSCSSPRWTWSAVLQRGSPV